jgi:hypothetical protein
MAGDVGCPLYHPALRRCEMESTWETRDLPVLDAIVRYFDEEDSAYIPDGETFAKITGMEMGEVGRAVRALSPRFVKTGPTMGGLYGRADHGRHR